MNTNAASEKSFCGGSRVAIERCPEYEPELVYRALKKAAEAAGIPDAAGKTVLLKPNILMDTTPDKVVTTHPVFLEAAIRLAAEWGASRILVGDSPGLQGPAFAARLCGLRETALKNSAEWVDFTKGSVELEIPEGRVHRKFTVTKAVNDADLIISLPKLKNHQLMLFTGAIKNTFGLIPSLGKTPFHVMYSSRDAFASMLVDLNLLIKPAYVLMDAVIAMEGPGPSGGKPRQLGLVLASPNILAADIAACSIVGYPPEKIPANRDALSRRFWLNDINEIEYPLLKPDDVKCPGFVKIPFTKSRSQLVDFLVPGPLKKLLNTRNSKPKINGEKCLRCGDCVRICASGAMYFTGGEAAVLKPGTSTAASPGPDGARRVAINYEKCISCYCCHEICSAHAIDI